MKLTEFKHDGKKYEIAVSDSGSFSTVIDDESVIAITLDKLKEKITRMTRRAAVRLALPATYVQGPSRYIDAGVVTLHDVTITGIHQQNKDILAQRLEGKHEKLRISNYNNGEILQRLTPAQAAEYLALRKARHDTRKAFETFEKQYTYTTKAIELAVAKAEQAAGIEESPDD